MNTTYLHCAAGALVGFEEDNFVPWGTFLPNGGGIERGGCKREGGGGNAHCCHGEECIAQEKGGYGRQQQKDCCHMAAPSLKAAREHLFHLFGFCRCTYPLIFNLPPIILYAVYGSDPLG